MMLVSLCAETIICSDSLFWVASDGRCSQARVVRRMYQCGPGTSQADSRFHNFIPRVILLAESWFASAQIHACTTFGFICVCFSLGFSPTLRVHLQSDWSLSCDHGFFIMRVNVRTTTYTQLAKMSIDPEVVEFTADVVTMKIFIIHSGTYLCCGRVFFRNFVFSHIFVALLW